MLDDTMPPLEGEEGDNIEKLLSDQHKIILKELYNMGATIIEKSAYRNDYEDTDDEDDEWGMDEEKLGLLIDDSLYQEYL